MEWEVNILLCLASFTQLCKIHSCHCSHPFWLDEYAPDSSVFLWMCFWVVSSLECVSLLWTFLYILLSAHVHKFRLIHSREWTFWVTLHGYLHLSITHHFPKCFYQRYMQVPSASHSRQCFISSDFSFCQCGGCANLTCIVGIILLRFPCTCHHFITMLFERISETFFSWRPNL